MLFSENTQKSFSSKLERKFSSPVGMRTSFQTAESSVPTPEQEKEHELTSNTTDETTENRIKDGRLSKSLCVL